MSSENSVQVAAALSGKPNHFGNFDIFLFQGHHEVEDNRLSSLSYAQLGSIVYVRSSICFRKPIICDLSPALTVPLAVYYLALRKPSGKAFDQFSNPSPENLMLMWHACETKGMWFVCRQVCDTSQQRPRSQPVSRNVFSTQSGNGPLCIYPHCI